MFFTIISRILGMKAFFQNTLYSKDCDIALSHGLIPGLRYSFLLKVNSERNVKANVVILRANDYYICPTLLFGQMLPCF